MNDRIDSALGYQKADIVLRNAKYVNVFTNELLDGDIAIKDGYFVGIGDYEGICEIDLKGKTVIPSFIDSHIHLESSIVSPYEFAKAPRNDPGRGINIFLITCCRADRWRSAPVQRPGHPAFRSAGGSVRRQSRPAFPPAG